MRERGVPFPVAITIAVLAAGITLLAADAGSARSEVKVRLLRLAGGDQVTITGTSLRCAVSSAGGSPTTIACGPVDSSGPRAGSFSFAAADPALVVLKTSTSSTPVQVARRVQPSVPGAAFPGSVTGGRSLKGTVGTAMAVVGTHVYCTVASISARPSVACGPGDGTGMFVRRAFVGIVSDNRLLVVRKLSETENVTVLTRHQPGN
jgi:hypothetical protein